MIFVVLVGLWLFVSFGGGRAVAGVTPPSRWRQLILRAFFFVLVGAGALGGATSIRGDWTGITFWLGIATAFWVVITCFGDLRKWGKAK